MGCFFSAFAATIPLSASSPQNMLQLPVERCHILWEKVITTQNFDTQFVFRLQYILFPVFGWLHIFPQGSRTGELLDPPFFLWARYAHAMMSFKKFPSLLSFFFLNRRYLTKEYPLWCLLLVVARMDSLRDTFSICCGFRAPEFRTKAVIYSQLPGQLDVATRTSQTSELQAKVLQLLGLRKNPFFFFWVP